MEIYVVRHGFSAANNRDNRGKLAFGNKNASLEEDGIAQARHLGQVLLTQHGVDLSTTTVATSTYTRAIETAAYAGFTKYAQYDVLNELEPGQTGIPRERVREVIESRDFPDEVLDEIDKTLENPPKEKIWITHGFRIAALCVALGQDDQFENLRPEFCEVRKLVLPTGPK